MKLSSRTANIRELLTSYFFVVPRFQRPYSWGIDELSDFWEDITKTPSTDYFIGSIVAYHDRTFADSTVGLVDGQQRLVTITLLLCAIRDTYHSLGKDSKARGLHKALIERANIDDQDTCTVALQEDYEPFFYDLAQRFPTSNTSKPTPKSEPEQKLDGAHKFLRQCVDEHISSSKNKTRTLEKLAEKLQRITVIFVTLQNLDDAYITFETLNARGKDLRVSDLVKNHLARRLPAARRADRLVNNWHSIHTTLEQAGKRASIDAFIHHQWLSSHDYVSERNLFREIKKNINDESLAEQYLLELKEEADIYRKILSPKTVVWPKGHRNIEKSLKALRIFGVRQAIPFVLSVFVALEKGLIKPKIAEKALRMLEAFHFKYTAIASQSSSGGVSMMYAKHARELRNADNNQDAQRTIANLRDKLRSRIPDKDEFVAGFQTLRYSDELQKDRDIVRYTLGRLSEHHLNIRAYNYEDLTIEHVAPQSRRYRNNVDDDHMANIGNLILVDEALQKDLGTKGFVKKRELLSQHRLAWTDPVLNGANQWTEDKIEERAKYLANVAYDIVWEL